MPAILRFFLLLFPVTLFAQRGIPVPEMSQSDVIISNFLSTYNIPGAVVAIARNGKIVYNRAFGYADIAGTRPMQPYHKLRIASVSKPLTAIAIMKLVENGQLSLNAKVFGPGGVLENHPVSASATITDNRIFNITVQHLLEHAAGWNRDINCNPNPTAPYPYFFSGCDPISFPLRVTMLTGTSNPVSKNALIEFLLERGLNFAPGTAYSYSNIGYLVLGRVIEQITGMSYEAYLQQLFAPLGVYDLHCGKNLKADQQERESEYVGNGYTNLSVYGTGQNVPWEYGGFSVEAMDAHGGWICTAADMLRILTSVDGFSTKPDILQSSTINTMVSPSVNNQYYAKGWQVNPFNNWWHTGALDGTASELVRTAGGYAWMIILNKRNITNNNFWTDLDNLGWNCLSATTNWPAWDLMLAPTSNANSLRFSNVANNSVTISWTNGNGTARMLVAKADSNVNSFPLDGTEYTANTAFGSGGQLGNNNYVVYNGTGNSVTVTGLQSNRKYYFRVIEYNKSSAGGNQALYLLGANPADYVITTPVFTFNGNGNWSNPANWAGGLVPHPQLPPGVQILINPAGAGECILNVQQRVTASGSLVVQSGKKFIIQGNLIIQQ